MQLTAFMTMNMDRHVKAHVRALQQSAAGEYEKANAAKTFYDEYFAVLDLTAEFYIETVKLVFPGLRAVGRAWTFEGRTVNPKAAFARRRF